MMRRERAERWDRLLLQRRSIRTYDNQALPGEATAALKTLEPEPLGEARVRPVLVEGAEAVNHIFRGLIGSYGKIIGAPALLVFVAQTQDPGYMAALGYMGQQAVLEATALGLATCWVGGAFSRAAVRRYVDLAPGEEVLCVTPVGKAATGGAIRQLHDRTMKLFVPKRKELSEIVEGTVTDERILAGLEAARWAPSSVNRQPWRFTVEPGSGVRVAFQPGPRIATGGGEDSRALDCGIAMANFATAVRARGVAGAWVAEGETAWRYRVGE